MNCLQTLADFSALMSSRKYTVENTHDVRALRLPPVFLNDVCVGGRWSPRPLRRLS